MALRRWMRRRKTELRVSQVVGHTLLLAAIWLVFSGKFDLFHLALGVVSVVAVLLFNDAIRRLSPAHGGPARRGHVHLLRVVFYAPWLLWQIIVSAAYVTKLILAPSERLDPRLVHFHCELPNELAQVVLGNSITLTPGTVTIDVTGSTFTVHALTPASADDLRSGKMDREAARFEGLS